MQRLLARVLDLSTDLITIQLRSLAINFDRKTKIATVGFQNTPQCLLSRESEWIFTIPGDCRTEEDNDQDEDDLIPQTPRVTIDTHFKGFTVLRSFASESDHTIE